jgi:hypothetical protein
VVPLGETGQLREKTNIKLLYGEKQAYLTQKRSLIQNKEVGNEHQSVDS